jgi:hypothetical protein
VVATPDRERIKMADFEKIQRTIGFPDGKTLVELTFATGSRAEEADEAVYLRILLDTDEPTPRQTGLEIVALERARDVITREIARLESHADDSP